MISILKQLQIIALLLKGGAGSGNFGHAGIPGQVGGSGLGGGGGDENRFAVPAHLKDTFESGTLPLRRSLKYDDQIAFLDNGKLRIAQVSGFGGDDRKTLDVTDYQTGEKFRIPRTEARMPKGGYRTRGE